MRTNAVVVLRSGSLSAVGACLSSLCLAACGAADSGGESAAALSGTVEVKAFDYVFHAPEEIASGWTTFRMENVGREHQRLLLYQLPEDVTNTSYFIVDLAPARYAWASEPAANGRMLRVFVVE